MRYFFCFFISVVFLESNAQRFPSELWHAGKVVLLEGDTIKGQIRYSQETDVVELMLKESNTAIALTGRKLLYFEIFDQLFNRYREFYALPYAVNGSYEIPILFEVIHEGRPTSILSRERIENEVVTSPYTVGGAFSRLVLKYNYYLLNEKGKIVQIGKTKRELIDALRDKQTLVKKYVKSNRIRPEKRSDLVRTISYYNSLFE